MTTALLLWLIPFSVLFLRGKKASRKYNRNRLGQFSIKEIPFTSYGDMRRRLGAK
jgi:hypothetical protein